MAARYWLAFCAASWLGCAGIAICAPPAAQPATSDPVAATQTPLTVANPFIGQGGVPVWALAVLTDTLQPRAALRVSGEVVDGALPTTYRLPNVTSFAPTPVDAADGPPPQAILPPVPPIGNPIAPQNRIAASPAPHFNVLPELGASSPEGTVPADSVEPAREAEPTHSEVIHEPYVEYPDSRPDQAILGSDVEDMVEPQPQSVPRPAQWYSPPSPDQTQWEAAENMPPVEPLNVDVIHTMPTPPPIELTTQLLPAVQRGFGLAQRGALYAAQTEFVQVLRRTAQARDAALGSDEHSKALAAGLRAIDEAEDFVPTGIQLEADLDVRIVASSHRTPALNDHPKEVLPHDAVVLYHHYAQHQLAHAVAGEQAGSMGLHGLGKIYARLAASNDDDVQLTRNATTMYAAAFAARLDNHLAANELGVMLCRSGRAAEAAQLFERTIDSAPTALAYHNLAIAQGKLGMQGQAAANEQESQRLAAWERTTGAVSRRAGVQWVSPAEMSRVAQAAPVTPTAYNSAAAAAPARMAGMPPVNNAPEKSRWQKAVELAKSLPLPGRSGVSHDAAEPVPDEPAASTFAPPLLPNTDQ